MISKDSALELLKKKINDDNLKRHMFAVSSVMRDLALRFGEDADAWEITGLLHDIDLGESTDPKIHGILGSSWLETAGLEKEYCRAVKAHAGHVAASSRLEVALIAADQLTGLIVACALVKGRKLANVTTETVLKRFKEKRFAAGADRNSIQRCVELNLSLGEFVSIGLLAMQKTSDDLGL